MPVRSSLSLLTLLALTTAARAAEPVTVRVDAAVVVGRVADDFMGLGYETSAAAQPGYFSADNARLVRLYRNLSPRGLIRIGGNVSDHTTYDPTGTPAVRSQRETTVINRACLTDLAAFARATGWPVMWGLNLGTGSTEMAVAEAKDVAAALGTSLHSFEIGNEVDALPRFHGKYADYHAAFVDYRKAVVDAVPTAKFSGPDVIGRWPFLAGFAADEGTAIRLLTQHYYRSDVGRRDSTMDNLLATDPKLAQRLDQLAALCREQHVPGFRINETNSFSGGGKPGVSDTMAGALWTLDYLFVLATHGAAGVNLETDINHLAWVSHYSPIVHDEHMVCSARPPYYGLLAFAAAGHGELLRTAVDPPAAVNLTAYAARHDGAVWVTVVNRDYRKDATVTIPVPGATAADVRRLTAPAVDAKTGVTFAGATVADDGTFAPAAAEALPVRDGVVTVAVPHASAAVVRVPTP